MKIIDSHSKQENDQIIYTVKITVPKGEVLTDSDKEKVMADLQEHQKRQQRDDLLIWKLIA